MKGIYRRVFTDKIIRFVIIGSFISIIIMIFYLVRFYFLLPPLIPLYNQRPWGETRLAPQEYIFIPFCISLTIFLVNITFAEKMYEKIPLLSRMLAITAFVVVFLVLLFTMRTIHIII